MNMFGTPARDEGELVRRRIMQAGGALALGGLALALVGTLVPGSGLPDLVYGIYMGVGVGLIVGALGLLAHTLWLRAHPQKAHAAFIKENDERERMTAGRATQWSFCTVFWALVPAMMVSAPLNLTVFWTLYVVFLCLGLGLLLARPVARRLL